MVSSFELIDVFQDTQRLIREDETLRVQTEAMQAKTLLYLGGFYAIAPVVKEERPVIEIVEDTSFHCAQTQFNGEGRIAVLNFANARFPGGGVTRGAMAQEECLCRSSNLYSALTIPYLLRNYYQWNEQNTGDMGSDAVIYSPGVTVVKTDDPYPVLLKERFAVDVITCAAPYYDAGKKNQAALKMLEEVFYHRIQNILEVAIANDVDILILGAFGCGAFQNPPDLVARVFYHWLVQNQYGTFFKKVIFAIKKNNEGNTNLQAFRKKFGAE